MALDSWAPTMNFRWVRRKKTMATPTFGGGTYECFVSVLQQEFVEDYAASYRKKWVDVPTEDEELIEEKK